MLCHPSIFRFYSIIGDISLRQLYNSIEKDQLFYRYLYEYFHLPTARHQTFYEYEVRFQICQGHTSGTEAVVRHGLHNLYEND